MNALVGKFSLLDSMKIKQSTCLDKRIFRSANVHIIGQANNQLILCLLIKERLILVFDQHAVHERIRYERILESAFTRQPTKLSRRMLATHPVVPPCEIRIPEDLCDKIRPFLADMAEYLGVKISIKNGNIILINQMPQCFENFNHPGPLQDFLVDTLNYIATDKHKSSPMTPFLLEQIKTKACRGAIRFNERLSNQECSDMIIELTHCKSCFRCAHGRVLVKPLLYLYGDPPSEQYHYEQSLRKAFIENNPNFQTQIERKFQSKRCQY